MLPELLACFGPDCGSGENFSPVAPLETSSSVDHRLTNTHGREEPASTLTKRLRQTTILNKSPTPRQPPRCFDKVLREARSLPATKDLVELLAVHCLPSRTFGSGAARAGPVNHRWACCSETTSVKTLFPACCVETPNSRKRIRHLKLEVGEEVILCALIHRTCAAWESYSKYPDSRKHTKKTATHKTSERAQGDFYTRRQVARARLSACGSLAVSNSRYLKAHFTRCCGQDPPSPGHAA